MDLTEIKSGFGQSNNRIVIKGLSKRQKDLLMSGGVISTGIGIGAGLFSLYSINEPNVIPGEGIDPQESVNTVEKYSEGSPEDYSEEMTFLSTKPIANIDQNDVSFNEAFKVARNEVGPGGWFVWQDKVFNTYYKEEWEKLSLDEKTDYAASLKIEENDSNDISDDVPILSSNEIFREVEIQGKDFSNMPTEPQVTQIINESGIDNLDSNVSYQAENIESIQIELDNGSVEFELQEDAVILEIPAGSNEDIDSMVFDATENNLFLNEREEAPDSIIPVELKNLTNKNVSSDDVELAQHWKNIVEEYPWGEPIIKIDHPAFGLGSNLNTESGSESIQKNTTLNKSEELTEYPWGETIAKDGNVSFAHDIQVIDDNKSISVNPIELNDSNNPVDEYPWGEQVHHSNELNNSQIDDLHGINDSSIHDNLPLNDETDFDIELNLNK